MSTLSPCPSCNRHVRIADVACPFCAAAMPARATAPEGASTRARPRMSRAAIFAAGATLAGMAACSNTSNNPTEGGVGGTGGAHDGAAAADGSIGGTGGAHDGAAGSGGAGGAAGGAGGGTGGAAGSGGRGGSDAGVDGPIAIYSAAFPPGLSQT